MSAGSSSDCAGQECAAAAGSNLAGRGGHAMLVTVQKLLRTYAAARWSGLEWRGRPPDTSLSSTPSLSFVLRRRGRDRSGKWGGGAFGLPAGRGWVGAAAKKAEGGGRLAGCRRGLLGALPDSCDAALESYLHRSKDLLLPLRWLLVLETVFR